MDEVEFLFDAEKLGDDYDLAEDENFSACVHEFKGLVNGREKMLDVGHFEKLAIEYATKLFNLRGVLDKVTGAYKSATFGVREDDLSPLEMVRII